MSADYVLSNRWARERERLDTMTGRYDPLSLAFCREAGLRAGAQVLEVGPGTGRFAQLLAEAVGSHGSVIAIDIDPSLAQTLPGRSFELLTCDVRCDPLPEGPFDLVHARLVLGHLPERRRVMERLVDRLRPGGWLVLEDFDSVTATECEPPSELYARVSRALWQVMSAGGFDPQSGRRLLHHLTAIRLQEVYTEGTVEQIRTDARAGVPQWELLLDQLEPIVRGSGTVTDEDLAAFRALLHDGTTSLLGPTVVRARGRRPA